MDVKIERFVLMIGGKEISLSVDEARELMRVLMDTFGVKATTDIPETGNLPFLLKATISAKP